MWFNVVLTKAYLFTYPFLEAESSALKFYVYPVCLFVRLFCTFDRLLTVDLFWILILAGFLQVCTQVHKAHVTRGSSK